MLLGVPAPIRMLDVCQRLLYVHSVGCLQFKLGAPLVDDLPFHVRGTMTITIGHSIPHQLHQESLHAEQGTIVAKEISRESGWTIFLVKVQQRAKSRDVCVCAA